MLATASAPCVQETNIFCTTLCSLRVSKLPIAAYVRVSTDEQIRSGFGLAAQRERIEEEARRRGWDIRWFIDEGFSGGTADRPQLQQALQGLRDGVYGALVAAKLDRLSRSVVHLGELIERAERERWSLNLLDFDVDTSKPTGRLVAHVLAAVAEFERQRIRERTREALAQVRAQGTQLGRPRLLPDRVVRRIARERKKGYSYRNIANRLNADGVPTAHGGVRWWASTVRAATTSTSVPR